MRVFLDTNILVYTLDTRNPAKQSKARELLRTNHAFVISTQVCQELFVTAVTKCAVAPLWAKQVIKSLTWTELVTITPSHIEHAIDLHVLNQLSFWDSLIISAAQMAKCSVLWTEDLNHNRAIAGVKITNPFVG
jgi:predicted nucleic acid-binding protein